MSMAPANESKTSAGAGHTQSSLQAPPRVNSLGFGFPRNISLWKEWMTRKSCQKTSARSPWKTAGFLPPPLEETVDITSSLGSCRSTTNTVGEDLGGAPLEGSTPKPATSDGLDPVPSVPNPLDYAAAACLDQPKAECRDSSAESPGAFEASYHQSAGGILFSSTKMQGVITAPEAARVNASGLVEPIIERPESLPVMVKDMHNLRELRVLASQPELPDGIISSQLERKITRLAARRMSDIISEREIVSYLQSSLLNRVLPPNVARALADGQQHVPETFDNVTIFQSDILGFTALSSTLGPKEVHDFLDRLYRKFDTIAKKYYLYKVETIGDAYVCAAGLNGLKRDDDTLRMVSFAAEAIHAASETFVKTPRGTESLQLRVGIHTGSVMACVTSDLNPRYSLIGEALQHAQALEANGEPMKISISQAAKKLLEKQCGGSFSFGKQKCVALEGRSAIEYFSLEPGDVACRATAFGSTTTSRSAGDRANDTWRGNVKELSLPAASLSRPLFDMHTRASNNAHDDDVTVSPQDLSALPALEVWQTGLPSWMSSAAWAEQGEEFEHAGPGSSGSPADGLKPCLSPNGLCTCGSSTRANQDVLGGSEEASRMASLSEVGSRGSVHCDVLSACSDAANSTFASDPLRGNGLLPREETSARYLMDDRAHRQSMPAIPSFCDDLMSSGSASFSCSSPSSLQPESETQVSQGRASKVIGTGNKRRKPKRFQTFAVLPGNTSNVNKAESKVDDLLHQMLPPKIAAALMKCEDVEPEEIPDVTVVFCGVVDYASLSRTMAPQKVHSMLQRLFKKLDNLVGECQMYKVETVGDEFVAASNLTLQQDDHAVRAAGFALRAIAAAKTTQVDVEDPSSGFLEIRVGIHTGTVIASVAGMLTPRYCLFGDTVNMAARMKSSGEASSVTLSPCTRKAIQDQSGDEVAIISLGAKDIKGKGQVEVFLLSDAPANSRAIHRRITRVSQVTYR